MEEVWKDYFCNVNTKRTYGVSTFGRRHIRDEYGNTITLDYGAKHSGGYKHFTSRVLMHRAVASVFIPNPKLKYSVHHKDYNKSNNNIKNLTWFTHKEQMRDAVDTGALVNGPLSDETKAKMSKSLKGRIISQETIRKRALKNSGQDNYKYSHTLHHFHNVITEESICSKSSNFEKWPNSPFSITTFNRLKRIENKQTRDGWRYCGTIEPVG